MPEWNPETTEPIEITNWFIENEDTIRTLLDQAINAPDLESLKREVSSHLIDNNIFPDHNNCVEIFVRVIIDHLAPRIVREGVVVVEDAEYKELKDIKFGMEMLIKTNGIATSKDD